MGDELGRARGEARFLAERTAARAEHERVQAEQAITDTNRKQTQLKNIHERMLATLEARKAAAVQGAHEAAFQAALDAAPTAAGAAWREWKPESALTRGAAPMLRIGALAGSERILPSPPPVPTHPASSTTIATARTGDASGRALSGDAAAAQTGGASGRDLSAAAAPQTGGALAIAPGGGCAAPAGAGPEVVASSGGSPARTGDAPDRALSGDAAAAQIGGALAVAPGGGSAAPGGVATEVVVPGGGAVRADISPEWTASRGGSTAARTGAVPEPIGLGGGTPAEGGFGSGAGRAAASEGSRSSAESGPYAAVSAESPGAATAAAADRAARPGRPGGAATSLLDCALPSADAGDASVTGGYDNSAPTATTKSLPALIPLLDRAHLRIDADAAQALPGLLLRAVGSVPAGLTRLHVYDPERLGGSLSAFAALGKAGLLSFIGPSGLRETLDALVETVRRVNAEVLAGEHASLAELAAATGRRPEPWRVLVLLNADLASWPAHDQAQLARLRRTGVAAGVHLVVVGDDTAGPADLPRLTATAYTGLPGAAIALDGPPPLSTVTAAAKAVAEKHSAGREPARLVDLLPPRLWAASSATGLFAAIGETAAGDVARLALGDNPPHALVGGPSGSGKTNLLYAWIAGLASNYSPDELALYLLDFKEGVSFARFASGRRDPTWLPHVRLVGVNINDDREFGLALLRHLKEELRRRAEAAKAHEATKLEELRAADPEGHWPRIVAVVDEFQVLLETRDAVTDEAVQLLEDLARRGRSQGIHLVLASQDIAGIEALWGRPSLVAQFTLRIALPKARRVLAENNHAADAVPRFHAVVNDESGHTGANKIVAVPNAGHADAWEPLQKRLWEARPNGNEPPALFDGDHVPDLTRAAPPPETALLGQTIDVASRGAELALHRAPGRNLAILGTRAAEAADILAAAALTTALGSQQHGQRIGVDLCCLEPDAAPSALALASALEAEGAEVDWHDSLDKVCKEWEQRCDGALRLNLVYAVDAGSVRLDAAGTAALRAMLIDGPERHLHTLGWWRSVPRLREDLGGFSARFDAVDAWLALDVQGPELAPLSPASGGPAWYPRERRGLYFDRARHRTPQVVIPYKTAALLPRPGAVLDLP
ncbi:FtsK/SpoIIIE domain-containing protein [Glycomyces sp. NPDC021274]|uniref:FtsK/SpoIIIE domain-containing protein n=1 Tax=Glycomyces sp. NPDC021274 TaxID=3155120 RepID=UPI00340C046F